MQKSRDIGFGISTGKRILLPDGRFNIKRINARIDIISHVITCPFTHFLGYTLIVYVAINIIFSILFNLTGIEHLVGIENKGLLPNLFHGFFFSVQTFTTVGYGVIHPEGTMTNLLASLDALTGILSIAIISGILLVRIMRREDSMVYSESAVVAPHLGKHAVMFRTANGQDTEIIEVHAQVFVTFFSHEHQPKRRIYLPLELERTEVMLLPLSWTIVHTIDDKSPLHNFSEHDFNEREVELIILISGYNETLKENFYSKKSYAASEIQWGYKFKPSFETNEEGDTIFDIDKIGEMEQVPMPYFHTQPITKNHS